MTQCPYCEFVDENVHRLRQHRHEAHGEYEPNRCCKGCSVEFYDAKAQRKFCSNCNPNAGEHNGNWKDAKESSECRICEREFEFYPSDKFGVYCSDCVAETNEFLGTPSYELRDIERLEKECGFCEAQMIVLKSDHDRGQGKFCSAECRDSWMSHRFNNPHPTPYHSGWHSIRHAAYERDNHRCQICGKMRDEIGQQPDAHHIIPIREFDNPADAHYLENIICLCRLCHRRAEIGRITVAELRSAQE